MKKFLRTLGAFLGLALVSDSNESLAIERRLEKQAQDERAIALRHKRHGLQKYTDGVNVVYARDEKNGLRKLRNLQTL